MKRRNVVNHLAEKTDLSTEPMPTQCLVEIYGDCRVLIENHMGISEYGKEKVSVHTKTGTVAVSGIHLRIAMMTKNRLVICGHIDSVTLEKGAR
jgi:sporulation protein YqfC